MSGCGEIRGRGIDEILCNCGVDFDELPEGCIAAIISLTSPRDASRYALVSKLFQSAADSDTVWKSFLPSDYQEIIARRSNCAGGSEINMLNSLLKKQLYLRLADEPLLIDEGSKSFALDKWSGKKIYMLAAGSLFIVWGNDTRYWAWAHRQDSRFQEVAHLMDTCWLEIQGKIKISLLSPNTAYVAYLVFKMADDNYGFYCSLEALVGIGGKTNTRNISMYAQEEEENRGCVILPVKRRLRRRFVYRYADSRASRRAPTISRTDNEHPEQRPDGWSEVEIGEFFINGEEDGDVEMALLEIKAGNWKRGLVVQGFEIRPKAVQH